MVSVGLQLALVPILAAHWGLERYGLWSMLIAVPAVLLLSDFGFATAATVRMTMQIARDKQDAARVTLHSASQVVLIACGAIVLLGVGGAAFLPDAVLRTLSAIPTPEVRGAILCLTGYSALILGTALLLAVLRSHQHFALGSLLSTITLLLESGLLVAAVVQGHGLAGGALALLLGRAIGAVVVWAVAARLESGVMPGLRAAQARVRRALLRPAMAALAIPLGLTLIVQGQVIALGFAAGAAAVPAFVAARTLSRLGLQVAQALAQPLMPEFAAMAARGNRAGMVRYFVLVLAGSVTISVISALVLALAGSWIVGAWSAGHIVAPPGLMLVIALSALCGGVWNPVSNLMLAINRHGRFAPALLGLACAGLIVTLATGAVWGATAAAIAMALVDGAMLIIVMRFAAAHWGRPRDWRRILQARLGSPNP